MYDREYFDAIHDFCVIGQRVKFMEKEKIILDTDMGSDSDDAGALAMLHHLADEGKAQILAVTHCASEISGPYAVRVINEYYGRADIPVGRYDKSVFLESDICRQYTKPLMDKYLAENPKPEFDSAVKVMRKALAENDNVVMAVIGMMNNIALLLKSQPDEISPLSGTELVAQRVKKVYIMGGNFKDTDEPEFNVKNDAESAKYTAEHCPAPVFYCGSETGRDIITGRKLEKEDKSNPVHYAYSVHKPDTFVNFSWDPITVYCAVMQDKNELFEPSGGMNISFDLSGRTIISEGGKDFYMKRKASVSEAEKCIDELIY